MGFELRGRGAKALCREHGVDWTRLSYPQRLAVLRQNGPEGPPEGFWTASACISSAV